jgi:hypothetical protein
VRITRYFQTRADLPIRNQFCWNGHAGASFQYETRLASKGHMDLPEPLPKADYALMRSNCAAWLHRASMIAAYPILMAQYVLR